MAWYKKLMRQKYNDPDKLKEYLDAAYGPGNWRVEVKSDRWIIALTRPWQEQEIEYIESQVRVHYDQNDSAVHD